jgi:hypothetical protein
MPLEFFMCLLRDKQLYLKKINHNGNVERLPSEGFINVPFANEEERERVFKAMDLTANLTYISCWYNNPMPTTGIFDRFTGQGYGIAVGTTYEKLCNSIDKASVQTEKTGRYHIGPVEYIQSIDYELNENAYFGSDSNTQLNTIVPHFIKPGNVDDERELRVLFRVFPTQTDSSGASVLHSTYTPKCQVDIPSLINTVAVSNNRNDAFLETVDIICKWFGFRLEKQSNSADGFVFYSIYNKA